MVRFYSRWLFLLCLFMQVIAAAQVDTIKQRIFLVGDAGALQGQKHPIMDWLKHM